MYKSQRKGEGYFLSGKVKLKLRNKEKAVFEVMGKHGVYETIYYEKEKIYECNCKLKYIETTMKKNHPFCSHCWAIYCWIKNERVQLGDKICHGNSHILKDRVS